MNIHIKSEIYLKVLWSLWLVQHNLESANYAYAGQNGVSDKFRCEIIFVMVLKVA